MAVIVKIHRVKLVTYHKMHECIDQIPAHCFIMLYMYVNFLYSLHFYGLRLIVMSLFTSCISSLLVVIISGAASRKPITGEKSKFTTLYLTELEVNGKTYIKKTKLFKYPTSIGEYLYNKIKKIKNYINNLKLDVLDNISTYFEKHKDD